MPPEDFQPTVSDDFLVIHQRLQAGADRMAQIEDALAINTETTQRIEDKLAENTASTKRIEGGTADLLEFLDAAKGAFKVLNWIARMARPIGWIALAFGSVMGAIAAFKSGVIGPK